MLRRRVPVRNPSICAFCQHRLALRPARPQFQQRFLSTTNALRDDGNDSKQDGPANQSSQWGSSAIPGAGGGWGSSPTFASSKPATESSLLPHELAARRRLQEQMKAKEEAAKQPVETKAPRMVFNPPRQLRNRQFIEAERAEMETNRFLGKIPPPPPGKPARPEPKTPDKPPSDVPKKDWTAPLGIQLGPRASRPTRIRRQFDSDKELPDTQRFTARTGSGPLAINRPLPKDLHQPDSPGAGPGSTVQDSETRETPPRPLIREVSFRSRNAKEEESDTALDNDNAFYSRDSWKTSMAMSTGKPKIDPAIDDELITSHRHFDGLFEESAEKSKDEPKEPEIPSTWGSLARKQATDKSSKEDFWAKMETFSRPAQPSQPFSQPAAKPSGNSFEKAVDNAFYKSSDSSPPQGQKQNNDGWPAYENDTMRNPDFDRRSPRSTSEPTTRQSPGDVTNGSGDGRRKARGKSERDAEPVFEERQQAPRWNDHGRGGGKQRGGRGGGGGRNTRWEDEMNDEDTHAAYEEQLAKQREKAERRARKEAERTGPIPIILPELISISNLASALKVEKELFLEQLAELGFEGVNLDSIMAGDTAGLVAQEYGYEPTIVSDSQDLKARPPPADPSILPPRPPVVTIMGHVDHGKTTLLDYLRKASVALQEHGGITQHIGAFSVNLTDGKNITFLDTPGHAAFLTMRQRGANVTDIVVLVVAADDSVKPQTIEAIKHARASKVPIIVAINKIDKEGARIDHVKADLATNGVEIEDYGGDVQVVCVSGKTGQGMTDLEENILALSEMLDMRAETDGPAEGWILESSLKPIGRAATVLVKRGTMRPGDYIAAGTTWAKIRHLRNEAGDDITEAPPGTPVEILGWRDLPSAGDEVIQAPDEGRAKAAVEYRDGLRSREKDAKAHEQIVEQRRLLQEQRALEEDSENDRREYGTWGTMETPPVEGGAKNVNFVVKGDVHGSVEAVCASILEIGSNEVRPRILRSAPGHIVESDVEHAAASRSTLVNFNLPIAGHIKALAEANGVPILDHTVIYHLHDDVKDALSAHLSPDISTKVLGEAEVLQVFPINVKGRKFKNIAGCRIRNGAVAKANRFRVVRGGETMHDGELESLMHGKKSIMEAKKGGECGLGFEEFQEFEVGDVIQAYEEVQTKRTL
ncbi:translation initiation factor IF-2 [Apiospora marii]|uniref:Translation initiation factor IF-2, mitochondrial n=1 Tax=Apiospora marii TaxID=335849 RepID=A0ABR1RUC1_9PEZI